MEYLVKMELIEEKLADSLKLAMNGGDEAQGRGGGARLFQKMLSGIH